MKKVFLFFLFFSSSIFISAQVLNNSDRYSLKLSMEDNGDLSYLGGTYGNYRLSLDYRFNKYFSAEGYAGYSAYRYYNYWASSEVRHSFAGNGYFYGMNAKFYLTPFIFKDKGSKFDIYIKAKLGGITYKMAEDDHFSTGLDYGIYAGITYYIWKGLGLNLEIGYGRMNMSQIGLVYRF